MSATNDKIFCKGFKKLNYPNPIIIVFIGLDKSGYQVNFFLFLHKNIGCGYSLEVPHRGASNEFDQHMNLRRNRKNMAV